MFLPLRLACLLLAMLSLNVTAVFGEDLGDLFDDVEALRLMREIPDNVIEKIPRPIRAIPNRMASA